MPAQATLDMRHAAYFVGREVELEKLAQVWQMAQQGHGSVVLIEAEAGGGKTHLAHEFGRFLENSAPPAIFLTGRCSELTRALTSSLDRIAGGAASEAG